MKAPIAPGQTVILPNSLLQVPSGGQLVFQLQPRGSIAAKMLVPSLDIIVKKTLAFEEFQSSFGKSKSHCGDSRAEACIPSAFPVSLRFSAGPSAEALCPGAAETGFLSVVVSGMSLALPVSAATALADMFEDEVFPPPFPMNVRVERLAFKVRRQAFSHGSSCRYRSKIETV